MLTRDLYVTRSTIVIAHLNDFISCGNIVAGPLGH
jgi:hypothetical protein